MGLVKKSSNGDGRLPPKESYKGLKPVTFRGTDVFIRIVKELKALPVEERPRILVYGDPDIDGLFAMNYMYRFLKEEVGSKNLYYYCNSNRGHGFFMPTEKLKGVVIFAVDFAIERSKLEELVKAGAWVVSMDHHDCEPDFISYGDLNQENLLDSPCGVVINNQYPFEDSNWAFQSGMGVVWHCCTAYKKSLGVSEFKKEDVSLVGLTLLSDVRDFEMPFGRIFLEALFTQDLDGYFGYLLNSVLKVDYSFGVPKFDRNFVDYTFSPKINSLFRFNQEKLAINFIFGKGYPETDYQSKQQDFLLKLQEDVTEYKYPHITFLEIRGDNLNSEERLYVQNFIGLLASKYTARDRVCIAYYRDGSNFGRASFRGTDQTINYREALLDFIDGRGHNAAFGIIGFTPNKDKFEAISSVISELVSKSLEAEQDYEIVSNLGVFTKKGNGFRLGKENTYRLSHNRILLKYDGPEDFVKVVRGSEKYCVYSVNGIEVRSFAPEREFYDGLILPMLERGRLIYQLVYND